MDYKESAKLILNHYIQKIKRIAIIAGAVGTLGLILLVTLFGAGDASNTASAANIDEMRDGTLTSTLSVNGTNISRTEFIKCVEKYKDTEEYKNKFAQYAGVMYDICVKKNINPIICAAQAGKESNFGSSVPANSPWNYWGIGVYNDSNKGKEFNSINEAITYYCDLILSYQKPNSVAYERAKQFAPYSNKITGEMNTIYDIYCCYAYLGDYHSGTMWKNSNGHVVNAKEYLVNYMGFDCRHRESDPTTIEEQAAYAVDYIDNGLMRIAKEMFEGYITEKTIVGNRIQVEITGETGGTYTKGNFGQTAVLGKFHSNITGLDHYIVNQGTFDIRQPEQPKGWSGKCNQGASFAILSGYTINPFRNEFKDEVKQVLYGNRS